MSISLEQARVLKSWPFVEAVKILEKIGHKTPQKGYVLFETGYGPSGLPHIGTFAEVARTTMVKRAFEKISDIPTKLICFSDDMDGIRKVPSNIPNRELIAQYIDQPLTAVPDPFGQEESYGHYMNKRLRKFLDWFGFEYEFISSTYSYQSGRFDEKMKLVIDKYQEIMDLMLPTLGEERQATYSPFMPICQTTGKVLQVPIVEVKKDSYSIVYKDLDGKLVETEVIGGKCKLQWKPDFGMRWAALDVDYEMYGKDHMPNAHLYSKICEILEGKIPQQFFYELFLDAEGSKISKSKGNSINIDQWLTYAPLESLMYYIFQSPSKAKRLYFDVIPKNVDEYIKFNEKFHKQGEMKEDNPVYHVHSGNVPRLNTYGITFSLLLNLSSICNPYNKEVLWKYIRQYKEGATPENSEFLDKLVGFAINYYNDFVKPKKQYITPDESQILTLKKIFDFLDSIPHNIEAEDIQKGLYSIGMEAGYSNLKDYFKDLYQILLGQEQGPRLGTFFKLYGIDETKNLIKSKI